MAQFQVSNKKIPPPFRFEPFKGIDLSATSTQITDHNSPDMLNFNIDERGALNKRTGYERVFQTSLGTGKINGLFQFEKSDGTTVFLLAHNTNLYSQSGSNQPEILFSGKADNDTIFFVMGDKCYIMDGTYLLVYDGTTVSEVTPYIPTLTISNAPNGGGSQNEDFNLIGSGFKESYSGTGTDTVYQLSLTGLDATAVKASIDGGVNFDKVEGTHFTVDRATGKVTWGDAPPQGTNNVIIQAYKTYSDKPKDILQCTLYTEFGGNNDTRVFVSGNKDKKNYVWRSGLYDPTYWPENGFYKIGNSEPVKGFVKQYDYLVIYKERSMWNMQYSTNDQGVVSFPIKPINDQVGCIAPKTIQIIENNPISLDEKGVYVLTASNVRDERNIKHVSMNIDPKLLLETSLDNAISVDFNKKYWLAVNGNVYVYDYQYGDWYIYDNIPADCFLVADGVLYFGSNGLLYKFKKATDQLPYNDDGQPINAYWYSKLVDFGSPEYLKIVRHLYLTMKPDNHTSVSLYLRTDKKGEYLVTTKRMDKMNFLFMNFNEFSFRTSDIPQEVSKKIKEKKITHIQFKLENNALDESLGVTSFGVTYEFQRTVK